MYSDYLIDTDRLGISNRYDGIRTIYRNPRLIFCFDNDFKYTHYFNDIDTAKIYVLNFIKENNLDSKIINFNHKSEDK